MQSVRELMTGIIDYAGLFPPASLDMSATTANFAAYRTGDNAWMLGRLIVPVGRLDEFQEAADALLPTREGDGPWPISVITAPADDDRLAADLETIQRFNAHHETPVNGRATVETIELKIGDAAALDSALDQIPDDLLPFFEIPLSDDPRGLITALSGTGACAKIRTGGVTPELFPEPHAVAEFIAACAAAGVPFKATAGLHHPLRCESAGVAGAKEYGFFNVFVGAALAVTERISNDDLVELLTDDDAAHFAFTDDGVSWRNLTLDMDHLTAARGQFALSYGSCSFIEPLADLNALGLL